MDVKLTEYVKPSSSHCVISKAFQKARRRFPIDGTVPKDNNFNSDVGDSSSENKHFKEQPLTKCSSYEKVVNKHIESSLINSLEGIEISDNNELISDHCQHESNNFDQNKLALEAKKEFENICDQRLVDDYDDSKNSYQSPIKNVQSHYTYRKDDDTCDTIDDKYNVASKNKAKICKNIDSESDPSCDYELPKNFVPYRETPPSQRRSSKRKTIKRHSSLDYVCEDTQVLHGSSCPCYEQQYCVHCQHIHRRCCCHAAMICCCSKRCYSWHDFSKPKERERSPICCKPSRRQRRSKRCSTCRRRISSRHRDTDSGIFTNMPRYENEEKEGYDASCALLHKDSFSNLQERYSGHKRNDGTTAAKYDEEGECRRRKLRKRLN